MSQKRTTARMTAMKNVGYVLVTLSVKNEIGASLALSATRRPCGNDVVGSRKNPVEPKMR